MHLVCGIQFSQYQPFLQTVNTLGGGIEYNINNIENSGGTENFFKSIKQGGNNNIKCCFFDC